MKFSELVQKLGSCAACNSLVYNRIADACSGIECDPEIVGISVLDEAAVGSLSLVESEQKPEQVGETAAIALILPNSEALQAQATARNIAWIVANHPELLFAQALALFYQPFRPTPDIHPTAVIHPWAQLGKAVYIGANVTIQANVKIGDNACIHPNVVIYPGAQIGARAVLHANCVIHERAKIGDDCVIHSGAVIGAEGFGFVPSRSGWFKIEQSGTTVLENKVEVGCNTAIDRAAVGDTRIGEGTKIDNLVQIGHSCRVGAHCALAAQVGLAGSCKVGNRVILAEQAGVANQVQVGDGVVADAKAGITKDVKSGAIVAGFPAIPREIFLKAAALYSRIPEIYKSLKNLQRRCE